MSASRPVRVPFVRLALAGLVALLLSVAIGAQPGAPMDVSARIDKVFAPWSGEGSPGCAIAVGRGDSVIFTRAYGMANLEYGVRISPDTIFEAGSVSKQFTAAAIATLAGQGKLSLDDDVRKYVPELPVLPTPITISELLHHTSGIRDQWTLLTLQGRPPGRDVHTFDEILDLLGHQQGLNFKPNDEYLYSNSGYSLMSVIVQRVSGKSLAEFTEEQFFKPLGMKSTGWRSDFSRIVKNRATAYSGANGKFRTDMPFTNVYGNGGLLTTVGDLLRWTHNLDTARVGGRALIDTLHRRGRLNDGTEIEYALGLNVTEHKGVPEVSHAGATAGYRAFLTRYPKQQLAIAVLCNLGSIVPERLAHQVADVYLEGQLKESSRPATVTLSAADLASHAGLYREPSTDAFLRVEVKDGKLLVENVGALAAIGAGRFQAVDSATEFVFASPTPGATVLRVGDGHSRPREYVAIAEAHPAVERLAEYIGAYSSEELGVTYAVLADKEKLHVRLRPAPPREVAALWADAFLLGGGDVLRFTRDASGRVDGFEVYAGRVRHLRFTRQARPTS
jgi:CubicO group peptidase (beta-lactamase class C family)